MKKIIALFSLAALAAGAFVWHRQPWSNPSRKAPASNRSDGAQALKGAASEKRTAHAGIGPEAVRGVIDAHRQAAAQAMTAQPVAERPVSEESAREADAPEPRDWYDDFAAQEPYNPARSREVRSSIEASIRSGRLMGTTVDNVACYAEACEVVLRAESAGVQTASGYELANVPGLDGPRLFSYDTERLVTTMYLVSSAMYSSRADRDQPR